MYKKISCLVGALLLPHFAHAVGVHQHGVAQLDVVFEPPVLRLALHSPLANLLGFEYQPVTAAEQASWQQQQEHMQLAAKQVILPEAARCSLTDVLLSEPQHHAIDHDHDHDHDHAHADLSVEYEYRCSQPQQLSEMQLPLLDNYPAIETLEVRILTPAGQHLQILSSGHKTVQLP